MSYTVFIYNSMAGQSVSPEALDAVDKLIDSQDAFITKAILDRPELDLTQELHRNRNVALFARISKPNILVGLSEWPLEAQKLFNEWRSRPESKAVIAPVAKHCEPFHMSSTIAPFEMTSRSIYRGTGQGEALSAEERVVNVSRWTVKALGKEEFQAVYDGVRTKSLAGGRFVTIFGSWVVNSAGVHGENDHILAFIMVVSNGHPDGEGVGVVAEELARELKVKKVDVDFESHNYKNVVD